MCLSDCLEVVPPVVRIVTEALDRLRLKLLLKAGLTFDDLLGEKLLSGKGWHKVDVQGKHTKGSLVGQADRQDLGIQFNLVAE